MPQDDPLTQLTPAVQKHFFEVFEANAEDKEIRDCIAISEKNVTKTYEKFNQEINQLAAYLQSLRLPPATRIGLFFEQSISYVKCVMAIMKVGHCFVPMNANEETDLGKFDKLVEESNIQYLLSDSTFKTHRFIEDQKNLIKARKRKLIIIYLNELPLKDYVNTNPCAQVNFEQVAYIHNTSGSTGTPKRIKIAHKGLFNCMDAHKKLAKLSHKDTIAAFSALTFDAHICEIMIALGSGAHLRIVPQEDRLDIHRLYNYYCDTQYPITVAIFSPSILKVLDSKKMLKLRVVLSTGEEVTRAVINDWYGNETLELFINGYGPSEVTIATCMAIMPKASNEPYVHIGTPITGLQCWVFDYSEDTLIPPSLSATDKGKEGELYISGVGVGIGYLDSKLENFREILNPMTNERMFIFQTRDKAILHQDGNLELRGRIDRQVKVYSMLISPEESEAVILNNSKMYGSSAPLIKQVEIDASLTSKKHPNFTAFYMTVDAQDIYLQELYQNIIGKMPGDVVPARWQKMTEFPLNNNGKVDRKALKINNKGVHIHAATQWDQHHVPFEEGELEYELLRLFKNALEIEQEALDDLITIEDNFLELGGTSLHVTDVVDKINTSKLGPISQKEFYQSPSVAGLSRLIRRKKAELVDVRDLQPLIPSSGRMQDQSPLFLIHSLLGDPAQDYGNFIEGWPNVRPVYCIKARGLTDAKDMDDTLEAIASDYVKSIQRIQQQGPYLIAGWSTGGMIALAISIELKKQGHESSVVMIDTECHLTYQQQTPAQYASFLSEKVVPLLAGKISLQRLGRANDTAVLKSLAKEEQIKRVFGPLDAKDLVEDKFEEDQNRLTVIGKLLLATLRYKQTRFVENVVLWNARNNGRMGWSEDLVEFRMVRQFNSNHHSILTDTYAGERPSAQMEADLTLLLNWLKTRYLIQELKQLYCRKKYVASMPYTDNEQPIDQVILSISKYITAPEEKHAGVGSIQAEESKSDVLHHQPNTSTRIKETFSVVDVIFDKDNEDLGKVLLTADTGYGKSTLCQHIVYRWAQQDLWNELFDYVFWIPLHNLKERYDNLDDISLAEIIRSECFKNKGSLEEVRLILEGNTDRILLVLDGLDAINHDLNDYEFLNKALQFKYYLVTSQPYLATKIKFDRAYEIDGFSNRQINTYIIRYFSTISSLRQEHAKKLISFIVTNGFYDLIRAPIRLSYLCIVWLDKLANDTLSVNSLSSLYDALMHYILKKYIKFEFDMDTSNWTPLQVTNRCAAELEALERIAFAASRSENITLISSQTSQQVVGMIEEKFDTMLTDSPLAERVLKHIGLLKQSNNIIGEPIQRPHRFTHFTIQAYFAAKYIVRVLLNKNNKPAYDEVVEFIRKRKYHSSLLPIFDFISGLLNPTQQANHELYADAQNEFFDLINCELLDKTEIRHAQLLISCLDQANFNDHLRDKKHAIDYVDRILNRITSCYNTFSHLNAFFPVIKTWLSSRPALFIRENNTIVQVPHRYDPIFHILQFCTSAVMRNQVKKYIDKVYANISSEMSNGNLLAFLRVNFIVALEGKLSDASARLITQLCEKHIHSLKCSNNVSIDFIYKSISRQCRDQLITAVVVDDLAEVEAELKREESVQHSSDIKESQSEQECSLASAVIDRAALLPLSLPNSSLEQLDDNLEASLNLSHEELEEFEEFCARDSIFFGTHRDRLFPFNLGKGTSTLFPICAIFLISPMIYWDFVNSNSLPFPFTLLILTYIASDFARSKYSNHLYSSNNSNHFFQDIRKRVSADLLDNALIHHVDLLLLSLSVMMFDFAKLGDSPTALLISTVMLMLNAVAIYNHRNIDPAEPAEEDQQSQSSVSLRSSRQVIGRRP